MGNILDTADRAYWWLRQHPPAAAGIGGGIALIIVLLLVVGGGSDTPKVPSGAVAIVGRTPIERSALEHWQSVYAKAAQGGQQGAQAPTAKQARDAAFAFLAGSAWITEKARREGVKVPDSEITSTVNAALKQAGATTAAQRKQVLQQQGISLADVRFQQRVSLLANKLQKQVLDGVPQPTDAALKAAYDKDPERWAKPSKRDADVVVTADRKSADAALAALKQGTSIADVVQKYASDSALSQTKGKLTDLKPGTSPAAVERALFSAPKDELRGPVKIDGGWMVYKVTKITPLPEQSFDRAKDAIKQNLDNEAKARATATYLAKLRKDSQAYTTCLPSITSKEYCGSSS